jgi:predicted dehydrogenase
VTGKPVPFAIIGCGLMGRELASAAARWCHLLEPPARPELVAVCDRRPELLEWFTAHFPTARQATADYREVLANPQVQAVYCAVPHNLHRQMYVDILEAGKHLLGEKPFGIDRSANRAILDAARRRPELVVQASSEFPFFPAVQRIVRCLREHRFGRILEVECGFLHGSDLNPDKPINWKRRAEINGEYGCMGDLGLHVFHVPLRAGWVPANVRAVLSKVVAQRPDGSGGLAPCDTWDNATLLCEVPHEGYAFPLTAKMFRMAPGLSLTTFERAADTLAGAQPDRSGTWNTCRPKSPMQPYSPLISARRFQLMGLSGFMSELWRKPHSTSRILPKRPSRMKRTILWTAGKKGNSDDACTTRSGLFAAAARISRLAARSMPKGFSPSRCLPA